MANFEIEVLEASTTIPVLVDFWAEWCGPCRSLGPVLEKLEDDYAGRFKLVKIDSDAEQQLSSAFGIRSLPTCILMIDGKPVDGFMGALPEGQVRQFLDKHLPSPGELAPEAAAPDAESTDEPVDTETALAKLADALAADPGNDEARFDYVRLLIGTGAYEEADAALEEPLRREPKLMRFEALRQWLDALKFVEADDRGNWSMAQFDDKIAANKRDFDTRLAKARVLMAEGEWPMAMDELLEIIMRDKAWNDQLPRKTYVAILELMTPTASKADGAGTGQTAGGIALTGKAAMQQDPQAELVSSYRRKLSMALN